MKDDDRKQYEVESRSIRTSRRSRVPNPNPDGIYTGTGVRNAIEGEGFVPNYDGDGKPEKDALERSRR
jgi:hypothetical protein